MTRREKLVKIEAEGRDKGKTFHIREMSSKQGEKWGLKALLALTRAGIDIPPEVRGAGMAGVYAMGVRQIGGLTFPEAEPLMDEMFTCVEFVPSPGVVRPLIDTGGPNDDIEEVKTRITLRQELIEMHLGFSLADVLSRLKSMLETPAQGDSSTTQTSHDTSASRSAHGSRRSRS